MDAIARFPRGMNAVRAGMGGSTDPASAMRGRFSLVFETSTPRASLAAVEADGRMSGREFTSDRSHNAELFSPLQEMLEGREAGEIGLVLVGSGPGSYSGTRVGIAAAQGVAIGAGCPAVALPSLLAVPSARDGAACLAIGDARRGSFWTSEVAACRLRTEPSLSDAAGLERLVSQALDAGTPVFSFESPGRFPLPTTLAVEVRIEYPNAALLWLAWEHTNAADRERWTASRPQPMYLKPPHITPAKHAAARP